MATRSERDSALVGGGFTRADGSFRIEGLRPGAYCAARERAGLHPVQAAAGSPSPPPTPAADAGDSAPGRRRRRSWRASPPPASARTSCIAPDRNSYTAQGHRGRRGGNASEVLDNVPVRRGGRRRQGEPARQRERRDPDQRPPRADRAATQLGAYLKSCPPTCVDRVEVVPNPSAKYDPEGMAGIINIVLKQNVDLGTQRRRHRRRGAPGQVQRLRQPRLPGGQAHAVRQLRLHAATSAPSSGINDRAGLRAGARAVPRRATSRRVRQRRRTA